MSYRPGGCVQWGHLAEVNPGGRVTFGEGLFTVYVTCHANASAVETLVSCVQTHWVRVDVTSCVQTHWGGVDVTSCG